MAKALYEIVNLGESDPREDDHYLRCYAWAETEGEAFALAFVSGRFNGSHIQQGRIRKIFNESEVTFCTMGRGEFHMPGKDHLGHHKPA